MRLPRKLKKKIKKMKPERDRFIEACCRRIVEELKGRSPTEFHLKKDTVVLIDLKNSLNFQ